MEPLRNIDEIFGIAFGYMASKALFAALHLGIFDAVSQHPKDVAALAAATGADERALTTLLTALTAVGLLRKSEEGFGNSPAAEQFLVRGAVGDFGDYLRYQVDRQMYPFMHNLTDVLRGRRDTVPFVDYEAWFSDPAEAALYSESQHAASVGPAMMLGAQVDLSHDRRLLDVGGGSGAFAITLGQLNPELTVTVLDFPNVLEVTRRRVDAAGLASRISYVAGNALKVEWPAEQDRVLFSYVSGSVSAEGVKELYRRAFQALVPGGGVIIHDFIVDDDRQGPRLTALWALQHATYTPDAVSLTPAFVTAMLREAGFAEITLHEFVPGMTRLVLARKSSVDTRP